MLANVMDVGKCEVSLKNACKTFSSGVATNEIKKNGNFKVAGMLNLKLKKKAATPAKAFQKPSNSLAGFLS